MRIWVRATQDERCGSCRKTIYKAQPMLTFPVVGPHRQATLRRCLECAGEPVPADLPPLVERTTPPAPTLPVRFSIDMLPIDFKSKAAND